MHINRSGKFTGEHKDCRDSLVYTGQWCAYVAPTWRACHCVRTRNLGRRIDTIRDAILTCARKLTTLPNGTKKTKKWKKRRTKGKDGYELTLLSSTRTELNWPIAGPNKSTQLYQALIGHAHSHAQPNSYWLATDTANSTDWLTKVY